MELPIKTDDIAGKGYWDEVWSYLPKPEVIDPASPTLRSRLFPHRRRHQYFQTIFTNSSRAGQRLLEIGCARSIWLLYFAKQYGFEPCGIDYSSLGCEQSREMLEAAQIKGDIACADFFEPPERFVSSCDVVVSFGVVEHFRETSVCVKAFSRYLKPGGLMITEIPNMNGAAGLLQKFMNKPVFEAHVPLTREELLRAHQEAGLEVIDCRYILFSGFNVVTPADPKSVWFWPKYYFRGALVKFSQLLGHFDQYLTPHPSLSPIIMCVARRPE